MYYTALDSMGRTITILFLAFLLFCFFIDFIYFVLSLVTYLLKGKGISTMAKSSGCRVPTALIFRYTGTKYSATLRTQPRRGPTANQNATTEKY